VTDNDFSDPNPIDPASVEITTQPIGGTVDVDPLTGAVLYIPDTSFWGYDGFSYRYADTSGVLSNDADVYLEVAAPLPPLADDDYFETGFREEGTFDLLENDWGFEAPLRRDSVVITSSPALGDLVVDTDGTVTYTPDPDVENDFDSFTYTVEDEYGNVSDDAVVSVFIGENAEPLLVLDCEWLEEDTWRFFGSVIDDQSVAALTVTLSGAVDTTDVPTDENGNFTAELKVTDPFTYDVIGVTADVADKPSEPVAVQVQ
jgi:hypothetical protein